MLTRAISLFAGAALLAGCSTGGTDASGAVDAPLTSADISMLFMGNSHASLNNLQAMVTDMQRSAVPAKTAASADAPGWMFLDERLHHQPSLDLLQGQDWSVVVLQAQKYSSSGNFEYSTTEAAALIRLARQQNALPVLFPEWARRGVDETRRIYDLHVSIAQQEPACVAPIGQAWDLSLSRHPEMPLHASDGNHANAAGSFLAALMLFATISELSPLMVGHLAQFPVSETDQARLRAVADDTVQAWPPRRWCPAD